LADISKTIDGQINSQLSTLSAGEIIKRIVKILGRILVAEIESILVLSAGVFISVIGEIRNVLYFPIDIPVISRVYKDATAEELSLIQVMCFIVAVPSTIVYKTIEDDGTKSKGIRT
jgi:hypothetical protein